jgi:hypothetical protein
MQIVVVMRNGDKILGNIYTKDESSPLPFPDYSKSTQQDFDELSVVINDNSIRDYARWYTLD